MSVSGKLYSGTSGTVQLLPGESIAQVICSGPDGSTVKIGDNDACPITSDFPFTFVPVTRFYNVPVVFAGTVNYLIEVK